MTPEVRGADDWQPEISTGRQEWRLSYTCPQCRAPEQLNLQPLPWREPAEHVTEERRRAGGIKYRDLDEVETQLWCHRCRIGVDVTVSNAK